MSYRIVPGVDGRELDLNAPDLIDPVFLSRYPFSAGTAGCALGHLQAYRAILEDDRDEALVLEDDVTLPVDLGDLIDEVAGHLTGAEVGLLNFASAPPGPLKISSEGSVDLTCARSLALPVDVHQIVNAGAYVITRTACARMAESLVPLRASADAWGFFYQEGILDRVRCVVPQPVGKSPNFGSTIGIYSLGNGLKARLAGPLVRHKIPVLHQMMLHRRQRIMRHWDRAEIVSTPFVEKPSRIG